MKHRNQFGAAFRRVRVARGLTQEDFTQQSGRTYISELERDVKQPTLQKIDELAEPLRVHPLTLLVMAYLIESDVQSFGELLRQVSSELSEIVET